MLLLERWPLDDLKLLALYFPRLLLCTVPALFLPIRSALPALLPSLPPPPPLPPKPNAFFHPPLTRSTTMATVSSTISKAVSSVDSISLSAVACSFNVVGEIMDCCCCCCCCCCWEEVGLVVLLEGRFRLEEGGWAEAEAEAECGSDGVVGARGCAAAAACPPCCRCCC